VQAELEITKTLRGQAMGRLQESWDTLPGIQVAEIAEHGSPARNRGSMGRGYNGWSSVGNNLNRVWREPPTYEAFFDESTRSNEAINLTEMCLDVFLAKEKSICSNVWKASTAAIWRRAVASFLVLSPHHQSVMSTNRVVIMKRHDDAGVWQNATYQRYELYSDK
jgi:hypothetical protein